MASSAQQIRAYTGPALFSYGFRPFFLAGAAWSALILAIWLPMLAGVLQLPTRFAPVDWHVHELVYGYVPAVVAGFLLTAVPNWTGRLPVVGGRLALLFGVWCAGRLAIATSVWIGPTLAACVDLSFLVMLAAVIGREIIAGSSTRNLKVLVALLLLTAGNALFHVEAAGMMAGGYGMRVGVATTVLLIMLIGGRIVPSFTRNWLARRGPGRMPATFGTFDIATMLASGLVLVLWISLPEAPLTGWLAAIAGLANIARLARWMGHRTLAEPLVLILHVGFAFVAVGFFLLALSILRPDLVVASGAVHGWTVGGIGVMTLAVMTRASLGHTGRPLTATPGIRAVYACAIVAAFARILAAFAVWPTGLLDLAAAAWVLAFGGFVVIYAPLLARRTA